MTDDREPFREARNDTAADYEVLAEERDMFREKAQNFAKVMASYDTKLGALVSGLQALILEAEQRSVMNIGVSELRSLLDEDEPPVGAEVEDL